ncbi:MAG: hypothetical protein AB7F64_09095 [Gammaproteobacteria bacterium]
MLNYLNNLIESVQSRILTSHTLVNRIQYPIYQFDPNVPPLLQTFKHRLVQYRQAADLLAAQYGQQKGALFKPPTPPELSDLTQPTFARQFVCALAVLSFGLGECLEVTSLTAVELIKAGHPSIAFVAIRFQHQNPKMEQAHQFLITNLPNHANPIPSAAQTDIFQFLKCVPKEAYIVDAFLGCCFKPAEIPPTFLEYIKAYGNQAVVTQCIHLFRYSPRTLEPYLIVSETIQQALENQIASVERNTDLTVGKTIVSTETTLIRHLNANFAPLRFFGIQDNTYQVDAVTYIENATEEKTASALQSKLKRYGRFFNVHGKRAFILEGINLPEGQPSIGRRIQTCLK